MALLCVLLQQCGVSGARVHLLQTPPKAKA